MVVKSPNDRDTPRIEETEATDPEVAQWRHLRSRTRRRRALTTGICTLVGVALAVALGGTGRPRAGLDAEAIPSPNPEARLVWHPSYAMPWFDNAHQMLLKLLVGNHAVPIVRFPALTRRLVDSGMLEATDVTVADMPTEEDLLRVHTPAYLDELERLTEGWLFQEGLTRPGENRISSDLYTFIQASVGGTLLAAEIALDHGTAMNLSGGYHHAHADHEEGFCFLNDVAISIERLIRQGRIEKAMIVDLDTHHGNGNAAHFRGRPEVAIFDMYEQANYPRTKVPIAHAIPLDEATDDETFLEELEALFGAVRQEEPEILFYIAGADPLASDILGNQSLTVDGLRRRDEYVLEVCRHHDVPCVVVLGGGYSSAEELAKVNGNTVLTVLGRGDSPSLPSIKKRVAEQATDAEIPETRNDAPTPPPPAGTPRASVAVSG